MLSTEWLSIVPWVPMEAITLPLFGRVAEPMNNGMWPMMTKLEASHGLKSRGRSPSCYYMRQSTLSHHWSRSPSFGWAFRFKTAKKKACHLGDRFFVGVVICAKERRLFEEEQIQKEARRKAEAQRCGRCSPGHWSVGTACRVCCRGVPHYVLPELWWLHLPTTLTCPKWTATCSGQKASKITKRAFIGSEKSVESS